VWIVPSVRLVALSATVRTELGGGRAGVGQNRHMTYDGYAGLRVERRPNGVLLITIDRPDKLNANDGPIHRGLGRIWLDVHEDVETRVAVITGAGSAFSAGGDLDWISEQVGNYSRTLEVMGEARDIVRNMVECEKPIVSAINGVAVGAGLACALMADISIIADDARLTDGHMRIGVAAGDHAAIVWPLLCGMAKAKYYLLTADFLDGREAERIGLVSKAVPRDDVLPTALALAERLATGPQDAIRLTKRALNHWIRDAVPAFEASLAYEMLTFLGPDAAEGVPAARERRPPSFPSAS
jgi:enoyl-CoA hydratase